MGKVRIPSIQIGCIDKILSLLSQTPVGQSRISVSYCSEKGENPTWRHIKKNFCEKKPGQPMLKND